MQFTFTTLSALAALASTAFASPIAPRSDAGYMIHVVNSCGQSVWPGVGQDSSSPGKVDSAFAGFKLNPGETRTIAVPSNWVAGRVFGRTGCTGSGDSFTCSSGDCGGFTCADSTGVQDTTLAEFSYSDMVKTFYNISLVSGFNLGMRITPTDGACPTFTCPDSGCPDTQAYLATSGSNPCSGCSLGSGYVVEFCPA